MLPGWSQVSPESGFGTADIYSELPASPTASFVSVDANSTIRGDRSCIERLAVTFRCLATLVSRRFMRFVQVNGQPANLEQQCCLRLKLQICSKSISKSACLDVLIHTGELVFTHFVTYE